MTVAPILLYPGQRARDSDGLPPVPEITFIGSPNFFPGWGGNTPIAIVIHTMDGFLAGTDATFNDPNVDPEDRTSAHFGVALDGRVHQYVRLSDRAWANGILETGNIWFGVSHPNPNHFTVSIETEDRADNTTPVSDALYTSVGGLIRLILETHPSITFLTSHHVISPLSRAHCCGARWTQPASPGGRSRLEQLARIAKLELRI